MGDGDLPQYKERHRAKSLRRGMNYKAQSYLRDKWLSERAEASFGADASDYSTIFMPWGPKWDSKKIAKMVCCVGDVGVDVFGLPCLALDGDQMYTKDMVLNSPWYDKHKKHHTHPCFLGPWRCLKCAVLCCVVFALNYMSL